MDPRIQFLIDAMKEHPHLTVGDLARAVNLSVSRLQHLFKAETNKTLTLYLRTLRVHCALQLIETSNLSIKQVIKAVGLKDRSHFDREFKKAFGADGSKVQIRPNGEVVRSASRGRRFGPEGADYQP